jgi:acylphosphatase
MATRTVTRIALAILALVALTTAAAAPGTAVVRKHWFVTGQVQGVGFRAFTYEAARDLKLKGWVRNLTDLRVEIVAEGPEKDVAKLLERVKKGPPSSKVKDVAEATVDEREKLAEVFEIRDTAEPPKAP